MPDLKSATTPHVLDDLLARVGKNNPKLVEAVIDGTSNEELIAIGATVATSRILTDAVRLYGEALDFLDTASDPQKRHLRGASLPLIHVAVHHLATLRAQEAALADRSQDTTTTRVTLDVEARKAVSEAVVLRDQAYEALRDAAGLDPTARAQIDSAFGVAAPPEALATGLDAMAKLLRDWLATDPPARRTRLKLANLDDDYAKELTTSALTVRKAAAAAARRPSPKATQAALDREDGIQTLLLGQIIRAFEGAHSRDATIPRLAPISTRRLFNRNTAAKRAAGAGGAGAGGAGGAGLAPAGDAAKPA